jgi:hypothetical protein
MLKQFPLTEHVVKKWLTIMVILLLTNHICDAQKDTLLFRLQVLEAQYGYIIPHSDAIKDVSGSNPYGINLNLMRFNKSFKSWSVFSSFWFYGLQAGYFNFQNPDVLGSSFLLTAFAEPVIASRNRFLFTLVIGGGFTYLTKIYDEETNPTNQFFCTRISFPVYVAARFRYRIAPQLNILLSGFYNHISNGGIKQPNYGMNFPTLALGLEHINKPVSVERNPFTFGDIDSYKTWYFRGQILLSYKVVDKTEVYPESGTVVSGLNLGLFRRFGPHYAIGAGAEYVNDRALKEVIKREGLDIDNKRLALIAGQDFHFGKVIFSQHFGFYIYSPYKAEDPVYQLYGLGVRLHPNLMTGVFIKAHRSSADFMGITLTYLSGKLK